MKFINVCVFVCAIALNFSANFAGIPSDAEWIPNLKNQSYFINPYMFTSVLYEEYEQLCDNITYNTMQQCADKASAPLDRVAKLFLGPTSHLDDLTYEEKCAVDCTMRRMGVMNDNGLDEEQYMTQIKKLRRNYTFYDITEKTNETKREILKIITKQAPRLYREDACFSLFGPKLVNVRSNETHEEVCYALIESYAMAASECKDLRTPDVDNCNKSWLTMYCMRQSHDRRFFASPFYPVPYTERFKSVLAQRDQSKRRENDRSRNKSSSFFMKILCILESWWCKSE